MADPFLIPETPGAENFPAGPSLPRVDPANPKSYDAIAMGAEYLDPAGTKKTKFWRVDPAKPNESYDAIPEGAEYLNPAGTKKTKPVSENVGLGTQTLFDMASGDPETQKQILNYFYGDDVRRDGRGFYVTQNGKRLRPSSSGGGFSGSLTRGTADVLAQALPVIGGTAGALTGAGAGSTAGPVGTVAAGAAGSALGYAAGKEANRSLLALAGFDKSGTLGFDRIPGELAEGAAFDMGGQVVGRMAGQAAAALKYGARYAAESLGVPALLRKIGGVTPESVARWAPLAEKDIPTGEVKPDGTPVTKKGANLPPQLAFPGAPILPILSSIGKKYDIDPVTPSTERYASAEIKSLMKSLGIPESEVGEPLKRTADVDYTPAGEAMHRRYAEMLAKSNADLNQKFSAAESSIKGQAVGEEVGRQSALAEAQLALQRNQVAARDILDAGWQDIKASIAQLRTGVPLQKPGDLVRTVAGKISATRDALGARYQKLYGEWDKLYGERAADVTEAAQAGRDFLRDLPDDVQRNHPSLVRAISKLDQGAEEGVVPEITTGQLHHIRSMLGDLANWQTLSPSFKNGQIKYFRGVIDKSLRTNLPESGQKMLDTLDQGYRSDFAPFRDPTVQKMVDWTDANLPPNPGTAAKSIFGADDETRAYLRDMVGKPVWDAVVGADMQAAMDASKSLYEGEVDGGKFINEFQRRDRSGVLGEYPPEVTEKMRRQAQYVSEITDGGKAPLPVSVKRGDKFTSAIQGAYDAARRVEQLSKADPIKAMESELKRLAAERKEAMRGVAEQYSTDPLGQILTNPNALVSQSAQRIIRDPQLLETASKRFGADSPEFKLLGRSYIKDVLTHPDVYGLSGVSGNLSKLTRQQQEQIFGARADDVILFAQNVRDILRASNATDAGSSIISSTAITHPSSTPLPGMHKLAGVPSGALRVPISMILDYTIRGYTNPAFFRFVAGSLRGSPEERAAAKELIRRFTMGGGVVGASLGSVLQSVPGGNPPALQSAPVADWKEEYRQRHAQ